jgi:hypothetical protein
MPADRGLLLVTRRANRLLRQERNFDLALIPRELARRGSHKLLTRKLLDLKVFKKLDLVCTGCNLPVAIVFFSLIGFWTIFSDCALTGAKTLQSGWRVFAL